MFQTMLGQTVKKLIEKVMIGYRRGILLQARIGLHEFGKTS